MYYIAPADSRRHDVIIYSLKKRISDFKADDDVQYVVYEKQEGNERRQWLVSLLHRQERQAHKEQNRRLHAVWRLGMTSTYKSLEDFVEEHNRWLSCFGKEPEYSFLSLKTASTK